jgi:hypothetical protein
VVSVVSYFWKSFIIYWNKFVYYLLWIKAMKIRKRVSEDFAFKKVFKALNDFESIWWILFHFLRFLISYERVKASNIRTIEHFFANLLFIEHNVTLLLQNIINCIFTRIPSFFPWSYSLENALSLNEKYIYTKVFYTKRTVLLWQSPNFDLR